MDRLITELEKKRGKTPVVEFADDLGIHYSTYYRLLKGERGIGADLQERILRRYPELTLVFLQRFSSLGDHGLSVDESLTESPQAAPEAL